jgi:hypothetical protein
MKDLSVYALHSIQNFSVPTVLLEVLMILRVKLVEMPNCNACLEKSKNLIAN